MKKHNFSAGPCILPQEVFQKASQAVLDLDHSGLSILEISHRSKAFIEIMEKAQNLALEHLKLPKEEYQILFLQGGASMQFIMSAFNLMQTKAAYLDTGTWSEKAVKEAQLLGEVDVVASSKDKNYNYIPKKYTVPTDVDYFHCTSNNTIFGTQIKDFPKVDVPVVCDMSSDIFSREIDFSYFDIIYAGAQKNMGPAGATMVAVKKSCLGKVSRKIPSMLDYKVHCGKDSMFNTPPVFPIYVSMLTLEWLKNQGGVKAIEAKNEKKANAIYTEIDRNPLFTGFTAKEDRSVMNATFNLKEESLKSKFEESLASAGVNGLNGHRSVGGYRASMYNALPLESVQVVVEAMQELEKNA
jgi:phosphoserine aminotransferase